MKKNYIEFISKYKVNIPSIQRDYVQGADAYAEKRNAFLETILESLENTGNGLKLDFIYGSSFKDSGSTCHFSPIDGQQRLTTLALLGWMLSQRVAGEAIEAPVPDMNLVYGVRTSTEQFVRELFATRLPDDFNWRSDKKVISEYIRSTPSWYLDQWDSDASVSAMLDMLDAVNAALNLYDDNRLKTIARNFFEPDVNPISFESLNMPDYNLTEDLYVKMNARGKHLTRFENWKAEFYGLLAVKYGVKKADEFSEKIEGDWCNLFWKYAVEVWKKNPKGYPRIDELFMRVYDFITEMLFYGRTDVVKKAEELKVDRAKLFLHRQHQNEIEVYSTSGNLDILFDILDLLVVIDRTEGVDGWLATLLTGTFDASSHKVNIFDDIRLFHRIVYGEEVTLPVRTLLFAILRRRVKYPGATHMELIDFVRVYWGWLLSRDQRLAGRLDCRFDFNVEHIALAQRIYSELEGSQDVFQALSSTGGKDLEKEREKADYRSKGKYEAVKILANHPYLRGNLINIFPALNVLSAREVVDRFVAFAALPSDDDRVRVLVEYGAWGAHPWRDYNFYGVESHWTYVFSATNKSVAAALLSYFTNAEKSAHLDDKRRKEYYMMKYPEFLRSTPQKYFYYEGEFRLWGLQRISNRPLNGYNCCPYAYTVVEKVDDKKRELLDLSQYSWYSNHGTLFSKRCGLEMECVENGWEVRVYDLQLLKATGKEQEIISLLQRNGLEESADSVCLITDRTNQDRIETALAFLDTLAALF